MRHPIQHTISRRRFVASSVATAAALNFTPRAFARSAVPACTLISEQEVGPFYVAGELLRANLVEDKPGLPLKLRIAIIDVNTCKPISNAAIDLWHCDALGLYSGYTMSSRAEGSGGPPSDFDPNRLGPPPANRERANGGPPQMEPTDKLTFLRGIQITDSRGAVAFQTIFPGFYEGRVNHIHFKVRIGGFPDQRTYTAGHTSHTGQIFFPEELAIQLMAREPYASHQIHRTTQAEDHVFNQQHGDLAVSTIAPIHSGNIDAGFQATLTVAVDPVATPAAAGMGGPTGRARS